MKAKFKDRLGLKERKKFWDRRINIAHRKINRKKYYGVGVEIEKYKDTVANAVDVSDAVEVLRNNRQESFRTKESLIDKIMSLVTVTNLSKDNQLFASISGIFSDSFKKGTRRLFTKKGKRVDVDQFVDEGAVSNLMQDQDKYFSNLSNDVTNKMEDTLRQGLEEGKSNQQMAKELEQVSDNFTRNRAETIARSEVIKASSQGTKSTMDKAGIEEFMWLSARNEDVCDGDNFHENFNGKTFTNCRDYDGATWHKDGLHPMPVENSHPNCRCTLVAEV